MSMISAQIDELRQMADGQATYRDARAVMLQAADTITELRGALQVASVDYRQLQADNAKLRELAENLLMAFVYFETPEKQKECIVRAIDLRRELDVLPMDTFYARELGIEVEG